MKEALILKDINLCLNSDWDNKGYTVGKLFENRQDFSMLKQVIGLILKKRLLEEGYSVSEKFELTQYHHLVDSNEKHLEFIKNLGKFFSTDLFGIELLEKIEYRVGLICNENIHAKHPKAKKKVFNIRIIRPKSEDNNPLHRDTWLDNLRNGINIYVPIAGSNKKSSLPLVPGSHYWSDKNVQKTKNGAIINGRKYTVPAALRITKEHKIIRPNPQENEVLVFSPYILHGGASNLNQNETRISLEMRFWKDEKK